jgi:formate dehydrogenase major subunit
MEFKYVPTTCPYCGTGCSFNLVVKDGKVVGTAPFQRSPVNEGKVCPKGSYAHEFVNAPDRLKTPVIKKDGKFVEATWEEAYKLIASKLSKYSGEEIAVIGCARASNEDNYALQKFARCVLQTPNVDHCARLCHASTVAGLAQIFGSGAMTNSVSDLADTDCAFIIGSNNFEAHPLAGRRLMQAKAKGAKIIVCDPRRTPTAKQAHLHIQHYSGTDIALLNGMMQYIIKNGWENKEFIENRTLGYEDFKACVMQEKYNLENVSKITGVPAEDIKTACQWIHEADKTSAVYTLGITQHTVGVDNVRSVGFLQMLTGNLGKPGNGVNPLRGQNNVQGACDMGVLPNVFPGYQKVTDPVSVKKFEDAWGCKVPAKVGITIPQMFETFDEEPGKLKAMYLMGENPIISDPDIAHIDRALKNMEFLVVQDIFLTETAQYADVVLPATCYAEKDGTQTNTERRVQKWREAQKGPGIAKHDWQIIAELAAEMGHADKFPWKNASEVFDEMAALTPQYSGMDYDRIDAQGLQWPCPTKDHPGTKVLHSERFNGMPEGKAAFSPIEHRPPAEVTDEEYPFILTTGATIWHWPSGTMTRRSKSLNLDCPTGWIEIHPEDAKEFNLRTGDIVTAYSRRGEVNVPAKVTPDIKKGVMFMPFHFWECRANWITNTPCDPVSGTPEYKVCAINIKIPKEA